MSVEQYQRIVNTLDKEIADLEKHKAESDKRAAGEERRAANVRINKNDSETSIRSKKRQIERYNESSRRAKNTSAGYQQKIAVKRKKRNDAYLKLQKEQQEEQRKEQVEQKKMIDNIKQSYETRIAELENQILPVQTNMNTNAIPELPEYDVFVSHAWEDKESFVDEFVQCLRDKGLSVWYDTSQIKWGDSMREKIDEGLKKSTFGVAILSPNYIAEGKYWTKAELDGLFQLDSINGKVLLPIWHNLTKKEVMDYSPIVAGRLAMSTALLMPDEIAEELKKLIDDKSEDRD